VDQLVEIMRIKGTPSKEDMLSMNHHLAEFNFPKVPDHTWQKVFRNRAAPDCIDLISKLVTYNPTRRLTPMQVRSFLCIKNKCIGEVWRLPLKGSWQACAHPYYDELRNPSTVLPDGRGLPTHILFNFTPEEIRAAGDLYHKLNPIQQVFAGKHA
jgi:serine/threonine protein kinase